MTESAKLARYWGRLAKVYDDSALLAGGTYPPIVEKLKDEFGPQDRVLDVGAGTGLLTVHIAPLVAHVTCTDIAPEMLEKAKERLANFREEAAPKYKEKINQLVEATDKAIEAVKSKARDAGQSIESLIKSIDSFLAGDKEKEAGQPDSN